MANHGDSDSVIQCKQAGLSAEGASEPPLKATPGACRQERPATQDQAHRRLLFFLRLPSLLHNVISDVFSQPHAPTNLSTHCTAPSDPKAHRFQQHSRSVLNSAFSRTYCCHHVGARSFYSSSSSRRQTEWQLSSVLPAADKEERVSALQKRETGYTHQIAIDATCIWLAYPTTRILTPLSPGADLPSSLPGVSHATTKQWAPIPLPVQCVALPTQRPQLGLCRCSCLWPLTSLDFSGLSTTWTLLPLPTPHNSPSS